MVITIIFAIVGVILCLLPTVLWYRKFGMKYIDGDKLPLRKKYRLCSSFGVMLFIVSCLTFMEMTGFIENTSAMWMIVPLMFMSQNRILFEPYYTSSVANELDEFCLYLRPFNLSAKSDGYWAKGLLMIPESIEKLFCSELNNQIAKTYCIGDPNAAIPTTISASGIYASDLEWKLVVDNMAKKCKLILLRVMETEGCKWELKHCVGQHIDKTIFLVSCAEHLELLKGYMGNNVIDIPNVSFLNESCIALYLDKETNKWHVVMLKTISDIKLAIKNYIQSHVIVQKEIEEKRAFFMTIKKPFQQKYIKKTIMHSISILVQPLWYIAYNKWPKWWIAIFVLYNLIAMVLSVVLFYDNFYLVLSIYLLSFLPWLWLGPRISESFNSWGSRYLCYLGNRSLLRWILIYGLLIFCFDII